MLMATLYEGYENRALLHWGDVDVFNGFFSAFRVCLDRGRGVIALHSAAQFCVVCLVPYCV